MANKTTVTSWIIKNREILNPNFTEFDWPSRYFPNLNDFEAILILNGITAVGRGTDKNKNLSIEKASAEAVERLICKRLGINSVGVAVSGATDAKTHACFEALERYYFNEHVRQSNPFSPFEDSFTKSLVSEFKKYNKSDEVQFYKMATPAPYWGIVCGISTNDSLPPLSIGLSMHTNAEHATERAFAEALINYARMKDAPKSVHGEILSHEDLWACDPKFLGNIFKLFQKTNQNNTTFELPELETIALDISNITELSGCPIKPVRCITHRKILK